jgi:hypothetical protein
MAQKADEQIQAGINERDALFKALDEERRKTPSSRSWLVSFAVCKDCDSNLVICQPTEQFCDYWWYCSNKECENHHPGEQLGDQDEPIFAKRVK